MHMFMGALFIIEKMRKEPKYPISWWLDKWYIHAVAYYWAIKKEGSIDTYCDMDEFWKHHDKKENIHKIEFCLCEMSRIGKCIEIKSRLVAAKGWRGEE